jgi:hypothetical protein
VVPTGWSQREGSPGVVRKEWFPREVLHGNTPNVSHRGAQRVSRSFPPQGSPGMGPSRGRGVGNPRWVPQWLYPRGSHRGCPPGGVHKGVHKGCPSWGPHRRVPHGVLQMGIPHGGSPRVLPNRYPQGPQREVTGGYPWKVTQWGHPEWLPRRVTQGESNRGIPKGFHCDDPPGEVPQEVHNRHPPWCPTGVVLKVVTRGESQRGCPTKCPPGAFNQRRTAKGVSHGWSDIGIRRRGPPGRVNEGGLQGCSPGCFPEVPQGCPPRASPKWWSPKVGSHREGAPSDVPEKGSPKGGPTGVSHRGVTKCCSQWWSPRGFLHGVPHGGTSMGSPMLEPPWGPRGGSTSVPQCVPQRIPPRRVPKCWTLCSPRDGPQWVHQGATRSVPMGCSARVPPEGQQVCCHVVTRGYPKGGPPGVPPSGFSMGSSNGGTPKGFFKGGQKMGSPMGSTKRGGATLPPRGCPPKRFPTGGVFKGRPMGVTQGLSRGSPTTSPREVPQGRHQWGSPRWGNQGGLPRGVTQWGSPRVSPRRGSKVGLTRGVPLWWSPKGGPPGRFLKGPPAGPTRCCPHGVVPKGFPYAWSSQRIPPRGFPKRGLTRGGTKIFTRRGFSQVGSTWRSPRSVPQARSPSWGPVGVVPQRRFPKRVTVVVSRGTPGASSRWGPRGLVQEGRYQRWSQRGPKGGPKSVPKCGPPR